MYTLHIGFKLLNKQKKTLQKERSPLSTRGAGLHRFALDQPAVRIYF